MKAISLFSGIGGFELAMQRAGIDVIGSCEIDKKARQLLQARFPLSNHYENVTELTGEQLKKDGFDGANGIITAGFPCQDLSVAGLRKGLAGKRSGLFWEIIRIIDETHPKFVILENVPGLLSSQQGRDMGIVITALVDRGYGVCWRVLDSQNFGVPQRRRRVFIVASLGDHRGPVQILFEPESLPRNLEQSRSKRKKVTDRTETSSAETSESIDHVLFEATRIGDPRFYKNISPTMAARWGTGGNNVPLLAFPMHGGMIGRKLENGPSGSGFKDANEPSFTLTSSSHAVHGVVVAQKQSHSQYKMDKKTSTLTSHEAKQFSDLVIEQEINSFTGSSFGQYKKGVGTLRANGGDLGGGSENLVTTNSVRRLTPVECERLQGFPDGWTAGQPDSARYKQLGNAVTVPVVEWIINRMVKLSMATEANKNESLWLD
jgi:DNA (cytosine-5)-methyltransferase 1